MNDLLETVDELRRMSSAELASLGEGSLMNRLREQAQEVRAKHGSLSAANLETVLSDRDCVRYPTRLVLEYGEMAMHQFAQPELDHRNPKESGRIIYLRPGLGRRPDLIALAVSYMIPIINYGKMISDDHCLAYGAALYAVKEDEYYQRICELAEFVGAEESYQDTDNPAGFDSLSSGVKSGCGGGCSCMNSGGADRP